jgi:GNAT superfamily N-acetyltransferase
LLENNINTMQINIRKALPEDAKRMMELIVELAIYEKAEEQVTVSYDHFINSGFGPKPVWYAFVADVLHEDGAQRVEAMALYYIRYSTWKGQRLYLEDILVTEKMRGKKIGQLLMDAIVAEAKANGYSGVAWQVLDWNEPAINFYKKLPGINFDAAWINCFIDC